VFVADHGGGNIYRYDDSGHFLGKHLTGFRPVAMAFGSDGGLYAAKYKAGYVSRLDPVTGAVTTFTSGGFLSAPHPSQITFGGPGQDLYVADQVHPGAVVRFDGTTGAFEQRITTPAAEGISGVAVDSGGTVYAGAPYGVIYKYSSGVLTTFATAATSEHLYGLQIGADGNLYVGTGGSRVLRYKPDGTPFGLGGSTTDATLILDSRLDNAYSLNFGPDGKLYVLSYFGAEVLRYGADGTFMDVFIKNTPGLINPVALDFGTFAPPPVPVPEPTTWMLFALGLAVFGFNLRRRGLALPQGPR
jgi:sugar lactone lactonase YvrE